MEMKYSRMGRWVRIGVRWLVREESKWRGCR